MQGERIVIIRKAFGMSLGTGCMSKLYIRILFCSFDHIILMSETVCEDKIAAGISKLACRIVALLTFGNIGL